MKRLITILLLAISGFASAQYQLNYADIRIGNLSSKTSFRGNNLLMPYITLGTLTDSVLTIAGGRIYKVPRSQFSGGGSGAVSSVFGRTGDVVAQSSDYDPFYPLLVGTYNNPTWINTLAYSKITGVPAFITTESDPVWSGVASTYRTKIQNDGLYYPLTGNPSGFLTSYSETDPLFNTKFSGKTTTDLAEGTNLYFTQARVSANTDVTANTAARHNAVTLGTSNGLSLTGQQLSLGLASSGVTGALSGSDWNTFNSKQNQIVLTTLGTSGTASLIGNTLNIPNYATGGGAGSSALRVPVTLASNATVIPITWSTYSATYGVSPTDLSLIELSAAGDRQVFTNWYSDDNGVTYKFDVAPETGSRNFVVVISGGSTVTSGNVTSVTSANGDISVTNSTTTPVLTLNSGAGANQIVKRNGSGVIADLAPYLQSATAATTYQTLANLSTSTSLGTSNILYPSQNAVKTYVDGRPSSTLQQVTTAGKTTSDDITALNYKFTGASNGAIGVVTANSSIGLISGSIGYGLSTNNAGGLDIMANQSGVPIRFWAGTDNTSPTQRVEINTNGLQVTGKATVSIAPTNPTDVVRKNELDTKQNQINGTGFVKATGTVISYDNTTYYPASNPSGYISSAPSQVQNSLTPNSTTLAPSVTAVNNGLALKSNDSDVVHKANTETITGKKLFTERLEQTTTAQSTDTHYDGFWSDYTSDYEGYNFHGIRSGNGGGGVIGAANVGNGAGSAIVGRRRMSGNGDGGVFKREETGNGNALTAEMSGSGAGIGVLALKTGNGAGEALNVQNAGTNTSAGAYITKSGNANGDALYVEKSVSTNGYAGNFVGGQGLRVAGSGKGISIISTNVNNDNANIEIVNSSATKVYAFGAGKYGVTNDGFGFINKTDGTYPLWSSATGDINIPILAGSGDRTVGVDASGTLKIVSGGSYTLPTASASVLGGVKVGSGLAINGSGILSATSPVLPVYPTASSSYAITDGGIYRFTGTTSTFTLPPVAGNEGKFLFIANRGSGTITLNTNTGANDLYNAGTLTNTALIVSGATSKIINDGVNWSFY